MKGIVAIALVVIVSVGVARLEIDNSPQRFISDPRPAYGRLLQSFGPDDASRLVVLGEEATGEAAEQWLSARADELAQIRGVVAVLGPAERAPAALRPVLEQPGASSLMIVLAPLDPAARRARHLEIDALLAAERPPPGLRVLRAGLPELDTALDAASREVVSRELPGLIAIAFGLLWWCLGRHLLSVLVVVAAVLGLTFGSLGWLGVELDLVLAVLPPLLFAMSVATSLHLLLRWREHQTSGDTPEPIETTWRELRWAVVWSGLTTMMGFLSLSVAPVAPVARLGLAAAGGMALLTMASLWVLPRLVGRQAKQRIGTAERRFDLTAQRTGRAVARRVVGQPRLVIALAGALAILAALAMPRLRVESDAMRYLEADHPVRAAVAELEERRLGVAAVQLLIETGPALDLPKLADLERRLARLPGVFAVAGPGTLPHPLLDPLGHHLAAALWWRSDARLARVLVSIPTGGVTELDELRRGALAAAGALGLEAELTGTYVELLETQRRLLETLGLSLVLSVVTIALLLWVLLGQLRMALIALAPNVWPVVLVLGAMGWFGIPLDVATVLVGAVVLGIAVDDSLHLLAGVRQRRRQMPLRAAVTESVAATTPAFLLTGLVLVLGFAVCGFSQFLPTARFGALAAAAIALAVVADLFLLPALLVVTNDQKSED